MGLLLVVAAGAAILAWRAYRLDVENRRLRVRLEGSLAELERLQQSFSRFTPQEVVERVIAAGASKAGERRDVTVLFADLVGFTPLAEALEPERVVRLLNDYFSRMGRAIADHGGHVSKLLGDGLLALFGALESNPWQTSDAVRAALAMRAELETLNRELAAERIGPLAIGIGIHRGTVIAGIVGSRDLLEFTVIGTPVNVASRVEQTTRTFGVDIVVTESVRSQLDSRFEVRDLGPADLRGVAAPIRLYALDR